MQPYYQRQPKLKTMRWRFLTSMKKIIEKYEPKTRVSKSCMCKMLEELYCPIIQEILTIMHKINWVTMRRLEDIIGILTNLPHGCNGVLVTTGIKIDKNRHCY